LNLFKLTPPADAHKMRNESAYGARILAHDHTPYQAHDKARATKLIKLCEPERLCVRFE